MRKCWLLQANYSLLKVNIRPASNSVDFFSGRLYEKLSPQRQWSLSSSFDLGQNWDLDLWLRYVDPVTAYIVELDAYNSLDVRLAWRPVAGLEQALVGQNPVKYQRT